jgi:phosphate transport system substrate-binding protein
MTNFFRRAFGLGLVLAVGLFGMSACTQGGGTGGSAEPVKLVLTGSSTVAPLAAEIAKRFEAMHPQVRVDVQTGGSSRGIADVQGGLSDIGMASRALKGSEAGLFPHIIARDGITTIVHADNPVRQLSREQIVRIYTGQITNWNQVGWKNRAITVVNKAEGRSTLELFLAHHGLKSSDIRAHVVIGDNEQGIKTVAGNPGAIGYVSIGTAAYDAKHGVPIRLLPVDGISASIDTVADGSFPISRPLNFVTTAPPTGWQKRFIDFARSDQVLDLIRRQYFVPPHTLSVNKIEAHGHQPG